MYQYDPDARPDSEFAPGELRWLVTGNTGRLLDGRRTPVRVTALDLAHGYFEAEILAFEDAGARWLVPLEDVTRYQFAPGGDNAGLDTVAAMTEAIARLDVTLEITADPAAGLRSRGEIAACREHADAWLTVHGVPESIDPEPHIAQLRGSDAAAGWLAAYLAEATPPGLDGLDGPPSLDGPPDLAALDAELTAGYVSSPASGDLVRAHLIVLAELGLCGYRGKAIRDPASLEGRYSRDARRAHIIARAGFTQALWARADHDGLMVYRGIGLPGRARLAVRTDTLISATFARPVAESHFNGIRSDAAALLRCRLPADRLLFTFLETAAMNQQFLEAEAVLLPGEGLI
jgi:hypothetical protein